MIELIDVVSLDMEKIYLDRKVLVLEDWYRFNIISFTPLPITWCTRLKDCHHREPRSASSSLSGPAKPSLLLTALHAAANPATPTLTNRRRSRSQPASALSSNQATHSAHASAIPTPPSSSTDRRPLSLLRPDHTSSPILKLSIVNDNTSRGECYGFVTFRNPRSAIDAINNIGWQVRTRGGRLGFGGGRERERFRRDVERVRNWDRSRDNEMDYDHERERDKDRYSDRSMEPNRYSNRSRERRSLEYEEERNGGYERGHEDHDLLSEHFSDRDRERDRDLEGNEPAQQE
ncbi:hypothetical protein M0R45_003203 [Rubus argutus]|uniref:RRM domain-containing protein n=1 Tax=Rubus argutus TaxID=59490 RepID=A0AAW1YFS0_RUBAR